MQYRSVNSFGVLGYMSVLMQWVWCGVTLLFPLVVMAGFDSLFLPSGTPPAQSSPSPSIDFPTPVEGFFVFLAIVFTIATCLYALFAIPRSIGKIGKTVTQQSAAMAIPHLTHHQKLSAKKRKKLTEYITWSIKLLLLLIPLIALLPPTPASVGLDHAIVIVVGIACGGWSLFMFSIQYLLAKLRHIDPEYIW